MSDPYYSQRARSVCVSLSAFFIYPLTLCALQIVFMIMIIIMIKFDVYNRFDTVSYRH